MDRCYHHFAQGIDRQKLLPIKLKESVHGGKDLDLPLTRRRGPHPCVVSHADFAQKLRGLVLMKHSLRLFPDIEMLLANIKQNGNVLLRDDVTLLKNGALLHARNDPRNVMTQNMPHCILRSN